MDLHVQQLVDHQEIIATLHRYAFALDDRDWELLETVFASDAVGEYLGDVYEGFPAIRAFVSGVLERVDRSQHLIANATVLRLAGDEAATRCYLHAQHTKRGTPGGDNYVIAGHYRDEFVRTEEGWRIARRRIDITWTAGNRSVMSQ